MVKVLASVLLTQKSLSLSNKMLVCNFADMGALHKELVRTGVLAGKISSFGRFDVQTKRVVLAIALALYDADWLGELRPTSDIGVLLLNAVGADGANRKYFADYFENGRTLGRANLFIYTLPSSGLGEVAIAFGLRGPTNYLSGTALTGDQLLAHGMSMIDCDEAAAMLTICDLDGEIRVSLLGECVR